MTASASFWKRVYGAHRGPLDVRAVCDDQHAHDWIYAARGRSYQQLWELCEARFEEMPRVEPRRVRVHPVRPLRAIASPCPRCGSKGVREETDHYGPSLFHVICGYRWEA